MKQRLPLFIGSILFLLICAVVLKFANWSPTQHAIEKEHWQEREKNFTTLSKKLQALATQVQALQGENHCETDAECRVVGIGTRVCGEYKNFVVYSIRDVTEPALFKAIEDFNTLHKEVENMSLATEACGKKPAAIHCIEGRCAPDAENRN